MQQERPYILSIAGFDPSGGAGVLADVKTFEQLKTYGLSVITGLTLQTEAEFHSVEWRKLEEVEKEVRVLLNKYPVKAVKFGIIPELNWLEKLCAIVKENNKNISIIVDPVRRSSTGFAFADYGNKEELKKILPFITVITPNMDELEQMTGEMKMDSYLQEMGAESAFLVKGGHNLSEPGVDVLHKKEISKKFIPSSQQVFPKHGSGCVLSSAIASYLALGNNLASSVQMGKTYIEKFLSSNDSLVGFHA